MTRKWIIYVDDRERGGLLEEAMRGEDRVDWRRQRLGQADFVISFAGAASENRGACDFRDSKRLLAVERKTTHDFGVSLRDQRLFTQAAKLANRFRHRYLLLEGPYDPANQNVDGPSGRGAQIALTTRWGLPVLRTATPRETVQSLVYLARQLNDSEQFVTGVGRRRPRTLRRRKLHVLQTLPGVGPKLARQLLDRYGAIEAVAAASPESLAGIPGIGSKIASGIYETLHEPAHFFGGRYDN